jgi:hypothetical protein
MMQTLQAAIELGITHLETAQSYGHSEAHLGAALAQLPISRERFVITSKILPTPDAAEMDRAIDTSLQRLKVDYLDCLALHGVNTWEHLDWVRHPNGCMQAIQQAIDDGRVRHVGFSTHGFLDVILQAIATDLFEFVNLHYTLFFQRNAAALELAAHKDMGIFIISPADKGGMLYTPPTPLLELCQPLSPLELNYRFLLADRRITTLSIGPANPNELLPSLSVADQNHSLTSEEQQILQRLRQHQAETLQAEYCHQCYACLPCPEAIHIPEVLRLRNLAVGYDMQRFGEYRYGMFERAGHWFPGSRGDRCTDCGDCLPRCPHALDIPALLKDTHRRLGGKPKRRLWET